MKCVHCGKERPYRWVGGQHCKNWVKQDRPAFVWPFPEVQRPGPYYNTRDYVYVEGEDEYE